MIPIRRQRQDHLLLTIAARAESGSDPIVPGRNCPRMDRLLFWAIPDFLERDVASHIPFEELFAIAQTGEVDRITYRNR